MVRGSYRGTGAGWAPLRGLSLRSRPLRSAQPAPVAKGSPRGIDSSRRPRGPTKREASPLSIDGHFVVQRMGSTSQLRNLQSFAYRLVSVLPATLHHRTYPRQWLNQGRPPFVLPSLLQRSCLEFGLSVVLLGSAAAGNLRPQRAGRTGRRRYLVPQTRSENLRRRHAPRPFALQSSAQSHGWGHDWVVIALVVRFPFWAPNKVWCLPLLARLYRNRQGLAKGAKGKKRPPDPNHRTRPELFREMMELLAKWFPERQFIISGDSAYGGKSVLRHLPANVDLISHVAPKAALYEPPPPRLPTRKGLAARRATSAGHGRVGGRPDQPWTELTSTSSACMPRCRSRRSKRCTTKPEAPAADDRAGPRHGGQTSRPDVLLHAVWTGRPRRS